jgi:hypothetical protein
MIAEPVWPEPMTVDTPLGRDAEACEAAARALEVDLAFTISAWIAWGGQSNSKLLIEGCRKAGAARMSAVRRADEVIDTGHEFVGTGVAPESGQLGAARGKIGVLPDEEGGGSIATLV